MKGICQQQPHFRNPTLQTEAEWFHPGSGMFPEKWGRFFKWSVAPHSNAKALESLESCVFCH